MLRTHTCGELTLKQKSKQVTLCGWNIAQRNHGGLIFIDLKDRYGFTQIVFDPTHKKDLHAKAQKLGREDVLQVTGKVRYRGKNLENPNMATGQIEILADELTILSSSETLPIEMDDPDAVGDDLRLKYRYLDMRRQDMQNNFKTRHNTAQLIRQFLSSKNFLEIETPLLIKSTPEGARDYVVPSRVNPGKFYALPQSPQIYKQILMVSGFDRYFQLARCLRDEDLRQDRQPEHTQIDLEMSFVEVNDIFNLTEEMMQEIFSKILKNKLKLPFKKLSYKEAMEKYGTDKPDLRFNLELKDLTQEMSHSDFSVFKSVVDKGGIVKAINAEKSGELFSRKVIDKYVKYAQDVGAKGLAWMKMTDNGLEGSIVKFFNDKLQKQIIQKLNAQPGDVLFFCADKPKTTNEVMNKIRKRLGKELNLIKDEFNFCWITDFPLFEWNEDDKRWEMSHHMFCMPTQETMKFIEEDPSKVFCTQFDLVLNGEEMGSGSLRINRTDIQEKIMKVIGFSQKEAEERFGYLLESFKYGAPPHGGIGIGFDRLVALMLDLNDIREVIAFPKNKNAQSPIDNSPSELKTDQLDELSLKLNLKKK